MTGAADSTGELDRLTALRGLDVLDTPPEQDFEDIVTIARALTGTNIAVVSLIDEARQWFKARSGVDAAETPRAIAFCDHVVRARAPVIVLDTTRDARFADNPLVTGAPFKRFYAGVPIILPDGHALGAVSVFDPTPRASFDQLDALAALGRQAAALLAARRRSVHGAAERQVLARDLERLWNAAHDLFLISDLNGVVVAANPAWTTLFGPLPAGGGMRMRDLLVDQAQRPDLRTVPDGEGRRMTLDYRGIDGGVYTVTWTLRREGDLVYGIGRDDTALKTAERELAQAQRMESLGQLTGGIAHDFNNLLTIVIGNLDIATRRLERGDAARVERALRDAGEGATRAAALTQSLLAFARRQRLEPRAIAPAALLADMRALIERAVSEAVQLDIAVDPDVWAIEADVAQLESAIINLAVNGRDAIAGLPVEGRLTIAVANAAVDEEMARRHGASAGDHVRFAITDNGAGMTEGVRARALEPFFTTKTVGRGTGLGLSQVEGFVRQSGGFVTIDSEAGDGCTVALWLPRGTAEPAPPAEVIEVERPAPRGACVMVVEDNDGLRELVVETLREAGYRVLEAHDGRSALSLFARQPNPPELVLSDVMMPAIDGFQLAAEIRARAPEVRVLLMSGYTDLKPAVPGVPTAEVLLVKPFTPAVLLDRVRTQLELAA